jgi:ABC-type sulfate/molybdate transport systems ATPase subunit
VAFPLIVRGQSRGNAKKHAGEYLEQFGVSDVSSQLAKTLSGGQSQRVAIARALIGNPQAVLLDEPLSAIDEESRSAVRATIRERLLALGVSSLIVSHNIEDVRQMCTRIENYTR